MQGANMKNFYDGLSFQHLSTLLISVRAWGGVVVKALRH